MSVQILGGLSHCAETGNNLIADVSTGGTFNFNGLTPVICTSVAAGTKKLPDAGPGTVATLTAAGAVTLTNSAGTTVATLESGQTVTVIAASRSAGVTTWRAVVASASASAEGTITIPLMSITGEDGTVLAKQASTTSGWTQLSNKNVVLNIPVNATNEAFSFSVPAPADINTDKPVYVDILASKSADNDVLTIDCELYGYGTGATLVSADLIDTAAQTIVDDGSPYAWITFTGTLTANRTGFGGVLTLGGTNDGDAVYIHGVRIRYTKL